MGRDEPEISCRGVSRRTVLAEVNRGIRWDPGVEARLEHVVERLTSPVTDRTQNGSCRDLRLVTGPAARIQWPNPHGIVEDQCRYLHSNSQARTPSLGCNASLQNRSIWLLRIQRTNRLRSTAPSAR